MHIYRRWRCGTSACFRRAGALRDRRRPGYRPCHIAQREQSWPFRRQPQRLRPTSGNGARDRMGDDWETLWRRAPGYEWMMIVLGALGCIDGVLVDTARFKGHSSELC
ncbi:MAG: hypothetical protein NXH97_16660 [Rhodobacteraceae bacterium]|nr:hypothetical protein [Paracoccaceae bacterium]